jgi:hypothetical protein
MHPAQTIHLDDPSSFLARERSLNASSQDGWHNDESDCLLLSAIARLYPLVKPMNVVTIRQAISTPIKVLSIILMTGAVGLESWHIYAIATHSTVPSSLGWVFVITRIAIVAHAIEGAIAAVYAPSRGHASWRYGMYTFFVGTIGLVELFTPILPNRATDDPPESLAEQRRFNPKSKI